MKVERIEHLMLAVNDIDETCNFYKSVFEVEVEEISARKKMLKLGGQTFSLHQKGREFAATAHLDIPGVVNICFKVGGSIEDIKKELEENNIPIQGMIERRIASGKVTSVYLRDPDHNLVEICNYL